jgi:hypothetical protein
VADVLAAVDVLDVAADVPDVAVALVVVAAVADVAVVAAADVVVDVNNIVRQEYSVFN